MKKLLLALALIFLPSFAWAQCTGVFPPNTLCGNLSGSPRPPAAFASGGTVVGPGSSTVNDIAVWNNTSGTLLKDVPFVTLCGSNIFSSILNGCVPSSGGGTSKFLRADGTWVGPDSVQVTYTPQGTGGVATTVASELNRTIWVNDYGAVCNGVTDDHVAFQNAINEGQSLGLPVRFSGACAITTGLSITTSVDFGGVSSPQSRIIVGSAGAVGIT